MSGRLHFLHPGTQSKFPQVANALELAIRHPEQCSHSFQVKILTKDMTKAYTACQSFVKSKSVPRRECCHDSQLKNSKNRALLQQRRQLRVERVAEAPGHPTTVS